MAGSVLCFPPPSGFFSGWRVAFDDLLSQRERKGKKNKTGMAMLGCDRPLFFLFLA